MDAAGLFDSGVRDTERTALGLFTSDLSFEQQRPLVRYVLIAGFANDPGQGNLLLARNIIERAVSFGREADGRAPCAFLCRRGFRFSFRASCHRFSSLAGVSPQFTI